MRGFDVTEGWAGGGRFRLAQPRRKEHPTTRPRSTSDIHSRTSKSRYIWNRVYRWLLMRRRRFPPSSVSKIDFLSWNSNVDLFCVGLCKATSPGVNSINCEGGRKGIQNDRGGGVGEGGRIEVQGNAGDGGEPTSCQRQSRFRTRS